MTDAERDLFRNLAFFCEDTAFAGMEMRPLSLMSRHAMDMMGLSLFDEDAELSIEEETRQMALFIWLHQSPLHEVCAALWDQTWAMIPASVAPSPVLVQEFRKWRARITLMLQAYRISIRPKPRLPGVRDDTPKDIVNPTALAHSISVIMHHTGLDRQLVKWHLFLPEALGYYQAAMRWNGAWTVPPGLSVTEEQVADRAPDWLKPPGDIDTPPPP